MFGLGVPEIAVILVAAVFLFGSSKLPQLGKGMGEAISGFRKALRGADTDLHEIKKASQDVINKKI